MADKKTASEPGPVAGNASADSEDLLQQLKSWTGGSAAPVDAFQLVVQALKQPSAAADTDAALEAMAVERNRMHAPGACDICGHQNKPGNQFCGMCGLPLPDQQLAAAPNSELEAPESSALTPVSAVPAAPGHHFYHHHYHHHYFPTGVEAAPSNAGGPRGTVSDTQRDPSRARVPGAPLTRTETAVRKVVQDWVLACNTRHLEDLVSIYSSDAILLRPNHPSIRGTAAIREFFVAALDAGFCDAELDAVRVEVFGDIAYEAGRSKALVPIAVSKRREERGKYLVVCARQSNGEWKIIADCWSSDLAL